MKRTLLFAALSAASIFAVQVARAATFSYHGVLQDAGKPAQGKYDIELTLYSSQNGGAVVGGPLTLYAVPVQDGSFSTDADFGPLSNSLSQAFVAVKVRPAGAGSFTALAERSSVVETNASCPGSWSLNGNAGNPAGSFLGTTDAQNLILKSHNTQVATAYTAGYGLVPLWLGGVYTHSTGQGGFIGGGGASSSSDSVHANSVGSFGVVCGGQSNSAGSATSTYATIGGGASNTASAQYSTVGGGSGSTASGVGATVPGGEVNVAGGVDSFAAGKTALARYAHSFVWSDGNDFLLDSGPQEFDVAANGGMAINGTPKNNGVELSIYPSVNKGNYSNIFFGQNNSDSGMLVSAGDATGTANNASFYLDQFDGTNQARKLTVDTGGVIVNDPAGIPSIVNKSILALGVVHSPGDQDALIDLFPSTTTGGYYYYQLAADANGSFGLVQYSSAGNSIRLQLATDGDFYVTANAYKPGGGTWLSSSDRRIKQDIEPIHDAVDTLMKLRPVNFHYTPEYRAMEGGLADKPIAGFVAQEYAEVFPSDVVRTDKHVPGSGKNDPTILALDPNPALITTVAAVQELSVKNTDLEDEVKRQGGANAYLEKQITRQADLIAAQQKRLDVLAAQMRQLQQKAN